MLYYIILYSILSYSLSFLSHPNPIFSTLGLGSSVKIYPGADEVGLTMLAKMSTQFAPNYNPAVPLQVFVVYRNQTTQDYVPNYEGQPMNLTVLEQIEAAGGVIANVSQKDADVVLLVNNFNVCSLSFSSSFLPPSSSFFYLSFLKYFLLAGHSANRGAKPTSREYAESS